MNGDTGHNARAKDAGASAGEAQAPDPQTRRERLKQLALSIIDEGEAVLFIPRPISPGGQALVVIKEDGLTPETMRIHVSVEGPPGPSR